MTYKSRSTRKRVTPFNIFNYSEISPIIESRIPLRRPSGFISPGNLFYIQNFSMGLSRPRMMRIWKSFEKNRRRLTNQLSPKLLMDMFLIQIFQRHKRLMWIEKNNIRTRILLGRRQGKLHLIYQRFSKCWECHTLKTEHI